MALNSRAVSQTVRILGTLLFFNLSALSTFSHSPSAPRPLLPYLYVILRLHLVLIFRQRIPTYWNTHARPYQF